MAANETDVEAGEVNAPEDSDLLALFKKYDENGDGVLDIEEFKMLLLKTTKQANNSEKELLRHKAEQIYRELDTNKDDKLDFEEFRRGYSRVKNFMEDEAQRKVETAAEAFPGGRTMSDASTRAATSLGQLEKAFRNPKDEEMETTPMLGGDDEGRAENQSACIILMCMLCGTILAQLVPGIFLILGWSTGQSCDQPLFEFCQVSSILIFVSIGITFSNLCIQLTMGDSPSPLVSQLAVALKCASIAVAFSGLAYFILGCIWFDDTGGLFDDPRGNCQQVAPDLWEYTSYYFWTVFVVAMVIVSIIACMCCLMCSAMALGIRNDV